MLGNLGGKIVFETSNSKVLNFTGFTKNVSGNWATHSRILGKAKSEFLGANLQTISFNMRLDVAHGVKPLDTLELLERMVEHGVAMVLVIGDSRVGKNYWKVTSISETWDTILNKGELAKASVSVSLEETL